MNKNFIKATLFAAFMFVATGAFVSCQDYDDDISGLQEQIDGIKTGSIATIEQQLAALKEADKALQGNDEAMKASIAALEKTKNDYIAADKALGDALKVLINGKVDQAAYDKAVKDLNDAVKGLEGKNADLAKKLAGLGDQLAAFKTEVGNASEANKKVMEGIKEAMLKTVAEINGKIAALEASKTTMAQVQAEVTKSANEVKALIKALEDGAIKDLKTATEKNLKLIQGIQTELGTVAGTLKGLQNQDIILKNAFEAGDKLLAEADKAIYEAIKAQGLKITELDTKFTNLLGGYVKTSVFDAYKKTNAEALAGLDKDIKALAGTLEGVKAQMATDKTAMLGEIDALKKFNEESKFQAQIDGLTAKIGDEKSGLVKMISDANASIESSKSELTDLITTAVADQGRVNATLATNIKAAADAYKGAVATLEGRLTALTGRVEILEGRVQSIVYIPEYTDGIVPLYFVDKAKKGALTLKFRVAPAAMAAAITEANLSFVFQKLQTRSAAGEEMVATKAVGDATGILTVNVATGDEFTWNSTNAVALVLKTKTADNKGQVNDVTTEYIKVHSMNLSSKDDFKVDPTNIDVEYTDTKSHLFDADFKTLRASDSRDIVKLGFAQGWSIAKINSIQFAGGTEQNLADIEASLADDACGFDLDKVNGSVKIKAKFNSPAGLKKDITLTLRNESTGFEGDVTYTITLPGVNDVDYGDISKKLLPASPKQFEWTNATATVGITYQLVNTPLANMLPNMTAVQTLDVLAHATTAKNYVSRNGNAYTPADAKDAKLVVEGGKIVVKLAKDANWTSCMVKTVFTTAVYGDLNVTAHVTTKYDVADLFKHQIGRWTTAGEFYVEVAQPAAGDNLLSIAQDLKLGYYPQDGVMFTFAVVEYNPTTPIADGVSVETGELLTFAKYVDLAKFKVNAIMWVNGNRIAQETYPIQLAYPIKSTFENLTIATYTAEQVRSGVGYLWAKQGDKYLELHDRYGRNILENAQLFAAGTSYTKTYGLNNLKFEYVSNNAQGTTTEALDRSAFKVDAGTGALSMVNKDINTTLPIEVKIKVSVVSKYGVLPGAKSLGTFTVLMEATQGK